MPAPFQDLRPELSHLLRRRLGTLEACGDAMQAAPADLGIPGRAGRRLGTLVAILYGLALGSAPMNSAGLASNASLHSSLQK